ncbi:PAS domain S-box protein [Synechococcus elongatus IITB4]|uniref:PAS domain S-box protein n=1 Tax=Synechococcus elongatus TaxID=32046 RepID=UPI0030D4B28D
MSIDLPTLSATLIFLNSLQTIALVVQSRVMHFAPRLNYWSAGNFCFILGLFLYLFASTFTIGQIAADYALILGSALIYWGTREFLGLAHSWGRYPLRLVVLCCFASLGLIEISSESNYLAQAILAAAIAVFSGLTARLLFYYRQRLVLIPSLFLGSLFLITMISCSGLATFIFLGLLGKGFISLEVLQIATSFQLLATSTLWTFSLVLAINQQAAVVSQEEQETAEKIFNASPDAILITRLSDGVIIRANNSFLELTGQTRSKIIGQSILDVDLWRNQRDRSQMIDCLLAKGYCEDLEVHLQRSDQSDFIGLVTAKLIKINGQYHIISTIRDITQKQQVELALRESEERFELAVRGSAAAIWDWNIETGDLYFSSRYLTMLGYEASDPSVLPAKATSFFDFLHPDDRGSVQAALEAHFSSAQYPYDVEYRLQHQSGEYRWFQSTGIAVRDPQGQPYRMVGSTIDVTSRKQAEEALRESEQNYRTVVNSGQALIWLAGGDGLCYYFNSAWLNFTGRSLEQESGEGWIQGVHPDDVQACVSAYHAAFAVRESFKIEYRLRRYDGEYRWVLTEGSPRHDSRGKFLGFIIHSLDIHDRKAIEAALYREQEFTRTLLDNLTDGVVACDAQGCLVLFNQAARDWHGFDALAIPSNQWSQYYNLYEPDGLSLLPTEAIPLVRAFNQEKVHDTEMMIDAQHCSPRWVLSSGGPFFDAQNHFLGAVVVMRDITAQREAERQLQQALGDAERFRAALNEVSSHVYMKDLNSHYTYANRATLEFLNISLENLIGKSDFDLFPKVTAQSLRSIDSRVFQGEQTREEVQLIHPQSGEMRFYLDLKTPIYESFNSGKIIGLLGIATDLTERRQLEEQLQQQATTDGLTGIINRRQFINLAQNELNRVHRFENELPLSLALIDIDHFKVINDSYGHTIGDQVLMVWADICQQNIREIDIFARLGGDEFVVLFPETDGSQAYQVMQRIRQTLIQQSLNLPQQAIAITISVGIAVLTPEVFTLDQLLDRADRALYQAKNEGRDRVILLESNSEENA